MRRGLVVVGSPSTLGADKVWRAWLAWVRDRGAFLTPNALPQLPWEAAAAAEAERQEVHLRALELEAGADLETLDLIANPGQDPEEEVVALAARASGEGSLGVALREQSAGDDGGERDAAASGAGLRGGDGGDGGRDVGSAVASSDMAGVGDELSLADAGAPSAGAGSGVGGAGSQGFSGADLEGWLDAS